MHDAETQVRSAGDRLFERAKSALETLVKSASYRSKVTLTDIEISLSCGEAVAKLRASAMRGGLCENAHFAAACWAAETLDDSGELLGGIITASLYDRLNTTRWIGASEALCMFYAIKGDNL